MIRSHEPLMAYPHLTVPISINQQIKEWVWLFAAPCLRQTIYLFVLVRCFGVLKRQSHTVTRTNRNVK